MPNKSFKAVSLYEITQTSFPSENSYSLICLTKLTKSDSSMTINNTIIGVKLYKSRPIEQISSIFNKRMNTFLYI